MSVPIARSRDCKISSRAATSGDSSGLLAIKSGALHFQRQCESHAAAVKIAPFAECNHLFSKGTDRLRLCQGRLDSILLDEAANLVCQQQISMLGFPAQFDRIFRVMHNSLKRHQLDVLAPS